MKEAVSLRFLSFRHFAYKNSLTQSCMDILPIFFLFYDFSLRFLFRFVNIIFSFETYLLLNLIVL